MKTRLLVLALGASLLCTTATVGAQESTCTDKEIARAQLLDVEAGGRFDSRDFRAALEGWKEAYTICPNYITAWNIARSYEELLELNQAREAFLLYANSPGVPPEKVEQANERIQTISEQVEIWKTLFDAAETEYKANNYAAALDGFEGAAATYAEPRTLIRIAACQEKLGMTEDAIATLESRVLTLSSISTVDREAAERKLAELRAELAPPPPPPEVVDDGSSEGLILTGWILSGVGVAALATGGVVYLSNASTVDDIDDLDAQLAAGNEAVRGEREQLADDLDSANTLLWVSYGVGAAALVSGAVCLTFGYMGASEETNPADSGEVGVRIDGVGLTPGGAVLMGRF